MNRWIFLFICLLSNTLMAADKIALICNESNVASMHYDKSKERDNATAKEDFTVRDFYIKDISNLFELKGDVVLQTSRYCDDKESKDVITEHAVVREKPNNIVEAVSRKHGRTTTYYIDFIQGYVTFSELVFSPEFRVGSGAMGIHECQRIQVLDSVRLCGHKTNMNSNKAN